MEVVHVKLLAIPHLLVIIQEEEQVGVLAVGQDTVGMEVIARQLGEVADTPRHHLILHRHRIPKQNRNHHRILLHHRIKHLRPHPTLPLLMNLHLLHHLRRMNHRHHRHRHHIVLLLMNHHRRLHLLLVGDVERVRETLVSRTPCLAEQYFTTS